MLKSKFQKSVPQFFLRLFHINHVCQVSRESEINRLTAVTYTINSASSGANKSVLSSTQYQHSIIKQEFYIVKAT